MLDPRLMTFPTNVPAEEFDKIYKAANDGIAKIADDSRGRFKGIATVFFLT